MLGAATAATASGAPLLDDSSALAQPVDDTGVLIRLLELERNLAGAYETAARSKLLDNEVEEAVLLFAGQAREHAAALNAALTDLGGEGSRPSDGDRLEALRALDSQAEILEFLVALEGETIARYDAAATTLEAPGLLKTACQIVCNEAQHLVVLRQQLGEEAVPEAFETGIARRGGSSPSGA